MAVIAVTAIPKGGLTYPTVLPNVPAGGGDRVPSGSVCIFRNGSGGALVVTVATLDTVDGDLVVADRAQASVAASGIGIVNIPSVYPYVDPTDGLVLVTTSVQASITFICINT